MPSDKIYEDLTLVRKRVRTVFWTVAVLVGGILVYYWKIQILEHAKYWGLAEANRLQERVLSAPRGVITDRSGEVILADNTAGFRVLLVRSNVKSAENSFARIGALLGVDPAVLRERAEKYGGVPAFQPVVIKDNLTPEEVARLESRKLQFPEIVVEAEPKRSYPFGNLAAHILGYLQEVSPEELQSNPSPNRHLGDMTGKSGIEKQYDEFLEGQDGSLLEVVDSLGRGRGEVSRNEPRQGRNISLTLDIDLQKKAEEILDGREGAAVVLDVRTGDILALASYPTYNPNKFISRFTPKEWGSLTNDPAFPLENRAIRGLYAPGSIFKLVMALGGLEGGFINERTSVFCSGSVLIYGNPFSCGFKAGHGAQNLAEAIRNSCNIYFYSLGRRMGIDSIARYALMAGLGARTGVDIPGEKEGLVPSSDWKMKTLHTPWFPGETISVSIGQGPLLVTPLQIAVLTAFLANRGSRVEARLSRLQAQAAAAAPPALSRPEISRDSIEKIIEGMWRSVNAEGTGKEARVEGFDVCGKTGSTQVISSEKAKRLSQIGREIKTHSWFTGFGPRNAPRVVVTILVEYGGGGGATAAPLARDLFELFRKKYD